jgi:outer membrane protein OmpA-like peptidoglycan-associated protein
MKKIITAIMLLAATATVSAQMTDHNNNLQLTLGGGVHTLLYSPLEGEYHLGFGGLAGIEYQYMFNHHWGLSLGVQASTLASSAKYSYPIVEKNISLPGAYYNADVTTNLYNLRESQQAVLFSVPLQLVFRAPVSPKSAFQMGLGAALDLPRFGTYKVVEGNYSRSAYMPRTNVTYDDMPAHGLGRYSFTPSDGKLQLSELTWSALCDLGFVINCNNALGIYLGIYGKYGFQNINTLSDNQAMQYNYNSQYNNTFASDRVKNVNPLEAGIKIALRIGMGRDVDWREIQAAEAAAAAQAEAERLAAEAQAEAERKAAEERALAEAIAKEKAEAEARAKAVADSIARVHAAERAQAEAQAKAQAEALAKAQAEKDSLAKAKAEAEARLKAEAAARAEAEARAKAEAEARERARAEQRAREEAAFVAGYKDVAYFETGKDMPIFGQLNEDSWINLKNIMDKHPEVKVTITGHTDNVGKPESNMKLSQNRANNIKKMLVEKGIPANRITAIGKGENEPVESNATPEGRAKNRRIEITIGK